MFPAGLGGIAGHAHTATSATLHPPGLPARPYTDEEVALLVHYIGEAGVIGERSVVTRSASGADHRAEAKARWREAGSKVRAVLAFAASAARANSASPASGGILPDNVGMAGEGGGSADPSLRASSAMVTG
jgi:hypothetical protein